MFVGKIYDNPHLKIVFERDNVTTSALVDGSFGKKWKSWKPRYVALREDGSFIIRKRKKRQIKILFDVEGVEIVRMAAGHHDHLGVIITCKLLGLKTKLRCIFSSNDLEQFFVAIKHVVADYRIDDSEINVRQRAISSLSGSMNDSIATHSHSAMRSAITSAMDSFDDDTRKRHMVNRRGAMKWLPPLFANDLVHGSWWFVVGSIVMLVMSLVVFANGFNFYIGEDDSTLSLLHYESTWALMALSGLFFTLGSLVFVRATHESPPMRPLFTWYHFQNDELLASWLFLFATLPFIPYFLIYLISSGSIIYIGECMTLFR